MNQREYCEAHGIPLKAFGNWREKFKVEPQSKIRKLLYRRGGLGHTLSHSLGHMAKEPGSRPIVPAGREGQRRNFNDEDKRRIVAEASLPGANLSAVARAFRVAPRLLFRWKQELAVAEPKFVTVEITDRDASVQERAR